MHNWEHPIMKKHSEVITRNGGDILELGFGMGISADYIQKQNINSHTIIENNEVVFEKLKVWAEDKPNVKIIEKLWYDAYTDGDFEKYDGIFYDTFADAKYHMFETTLPHIVKENARVSCFNYNNRSWILKDDEFGNVIYNQVESLPLPADTIIGGNIVRNNEGKPVKLNNVPMKIFTEIDSEL